MRARAVARRPPARHRQGRPRASQRLSRRLRLPRRRHSRAAAGALPRRRARLRPAAASRWCWRISRTTRPAASTSPPTTTRSLIHRSKAFSDDATPSGNGIAAQVLLRLGHLLGEPRYLAAAERTLRAAWRALERYPQSHVSLRQCARGAAAAAGDRDPARRTRAASRNGASSWRASTRRGGWCWRSRPTPPTCRRRWPTRHRAVRRSPTCAAAASARRRSSRSPRSSARYAHDPRADAPHPRADAPHGRRQSSGSEPRPFR